MPIALHSLLVFVLSSVLLLRAGKLVKRRDYVRLFGELYVPVFLLVVYGFRGLPLFFEDSDARLGYAGVDFSDLDVFLSFLVISGAIVMIPLGFRIAFRYRPASHRSGHEQRGHLRGATIFLLAALIFDAVARVKMIAGGSYFSWLRAELVLAGEIVPGGPLTQMQVVLEPMIGALLCLHAIRSKKWLPYLILFVFLVLLKGQRGALFSVGIAIALTYAVFSAKALSWKRIVLYSTSAVLLAALSSSLIVDLRHQYRAGGGHALQDPQSFMMDIVQVHLPAAISQDVRSEELARKSGLYARLSFWQRSLASEMNRTRHGWGRMPMRDFLRALTLPVPSILYPGTKPAIEQGAAASRWYAIGADDPGTTIFSDIFRFGGLTGVLILGLVYGLLNGAFGRFMVGRYGTAGIALFFGTASVMTVRANSFAALLVGCRNLLLVILLLEIAWLVRRLRRTSRGRSLEGSIA